MDQIERQMIDEAQENLGIIKNRMRRLIKQMGEISTLNREAERFEAGNDAMKFQGVVGSALGDLTQGHADVSNALLKHWPDDGGIIIQGGGGR